MLNSTLESLPPKVQEVIRAEFTAVPASADLKKLNAEFKAKHGASVAHSLAAVRAEKILGAEASQCVEEAVGLLKANKNLTLSEAKAILDTLRGWGGSAAGTLKSLARERWPHCALFA